MTPLGQCIEGPDLAPPEPLTRHTTIGEIIEHVRLEALRRMAAEPGGLDDIAAIDAGFGLDEIAAFRRDIGSPPDGRDGPFNACCYRDQCAADVKTAQAHAAALEDCLAHALIDNQILRGRRDELLDATNRYQQEARDARAEVAALRSSPPPPAVERSSLIVAASEAMSALRPIAESAAPIGEGWSDSRARASVSGKQITIGHCRAAHAAYQRLVGILGPEAQIRWVARADMDADAAIALYRESEVLIQTENGIWRAGAVGYTSDSLLAGRWNGADAWHMTEGLGAEKQVRFGIPVADPVTV